MANRPAGPAGGGDRLLSAAPDSGSTATQRGKAPPSARIPDVAALRAWLLGDAIVSADGATLSWANPRHPGYAYPEAGGLYLSTMCTAPCAGAPGLAAADRVAAWLCGNLEANGGAGRGGTTYLFDSAVVLAGLLRYRAAGGRVAVAAAIGRLRAFIAEQIATGMAVLPREAAADGRWSTQFGAHQVKCLHALHLAARANGEVLAPGVIAALVNRAGQQPSPVYLHPFCYEQEGHLIAAHHGLADLFEPLEGGLEWLAALQQADGSLLAFANGMEGFGEPRSDATAQAVRLWLSGDRARYGGAIEAGLGFLATCQTAAGGIRYTPGSDDVCSWSTMFTLQAVEWFLDGPKPDELL